MKHVQNLAVMMLAAAMIFTANGVRRARVELRQLRDRVDSNYELLRLRSSTSAAGVISVWETPDGKWQIRVARPVDGLFEIVPTVPPEPIKPKPRPGQPAPGFPAAPNFIPRPDPQFPSLNI